MTPPALLSRSSSLPISPESSRRVSLPSRTDPQTVFADVPMTPPLSPEVDTIQIIADPLETPESDGTGPESTAIAVDDSQSLSNTMQVDDAEKVVSPQPPQRLLEDERVHLQRSGLKLSDFEVRGTLGTVTDTLSAPQVLMKTQVLARLARFCSYAIEALLLTQPSKITLP